MFGWFSKAADMNGSWTSCLRASGESITELTADRESDCLSENTGPGPHRPTIQGVQKPSYIGCLQTSSWNGYSQYQLKCSRRKFHSTVLSLNLLEQDRLEKCEKAKCGHVEPLHSAWLALKVLKRRRQDTLYLMGMEQRNDQGDVWPGWLLLERSNRRSNVFCSMARSNEVPAHQLCLSHSQPCISYRTPHSKPGSETQV